MSLDSRLRTRRTSYERMQQERENQIQVMQQENDMLKEQLVRYQTQIQMANEQLLQIKQRYQMLINELTLREKAADEISRLALKEANTIIETAQGNADLIIKEALSNAKMVFVEIERIANQTNEMRADIHTKLHSMDDMLRDFRMPEVPNLDFLAGKHDSGSESNK